MELLVIIIVLALIFDYINGFHDAANSIATIVSTKVLTPFQAVIWAAFFNFVAFFIAKCVIGGFGIANTVSKTVMEPVSPQNSKDKKDSKYDKSRKIKVLRDFLFLFSDIYQ